MYSSRFIFKDILSVFYEIPQRTFKMHKIEENGTGFFWTFDSKMPSRALFSLNKSLQIVYKSDTQM